MSWTTKHPVRRPAPQDTPLLRRCVPPATQACAATAAQSISITMRAPSRHVQRPLPQVTLTTSPVTLPSAASVQPLRMSPVAAIARCSKAGACTCIACTEAKQQGCARRRRLAVLRRVHASAADRPIWRVVAQAEQPSHRIVELAAR